MKISHKKADTTKMICFEYTSCPQCGAISNFIVYEQFYPYMIACCRSCNFHYLSPRLTEPAIMSDYKKYEYFKRKNLGYLNYSEQETALRATFRKLLTNLSKKCLTGGSLLEVGCGFGYFLSEATSFFDFRVGTDYSPQAVIEASKNAVCRIYQGGVDQLDNEILFDCIVAIHVIEHVYQPRDFIAKLVSKLKKGGVLVLATPDMGSFWRKLMGHHWPSFKIPEHVLFLDQKSLNRLMHTGGLDDIRSLTYPHAFPLSLIFSKLNLHILNIHSNIYLWLPKTTICAYGTNK